MGEVGGLSSSNMLRFNGLATGMDTDAMVKKMMLAENMKVDRVRQAKQYDEWKQEAYVDIIKDLKGLYRDYLDIANASSDNNVLKNSLYSTSKVTSSDENIVTATGLAGALNGVYKVKVTKVANAAIAKSTQMSKDTTLSTKLSDLKDKDGNAMGVGTTLSITVGGDKVFTIDNLTADDTITTLKDKINNAKLIKNGKTLNLKDYIKVNYSELTNKITIETRETGANAKLKFDGTVASGLGMQGVGTLDASGNITGNDAELEIKSPGEADFVKVNKSSNNFTIDNITYNLNDVSSDPTKEITLNLKSDASESVDKISKFIDKYNEIVSKIKTKVEEKKQYNYKPLTSDQKSSMKEDEIKNWETKAKQGLLKNDMNLQKMLSDMRRAFSDSVEGAGITFKEAGIDTSNLISDGGKIVLDKDKLKKALEERGDQVIKLFTQSPSKVITSDSSVADKKVYYDESGIFQRIKNITNDYVGYNGTLIKKSGYQNTRFVTNNELSKSIEEKDKKIKNMEKILYSKQERYYQMFARLEKAMNQMNTQSSWLATQLGGGM